MDESMVKRVADAIDDKLSDFPEMGRARIERLARTAIEAMREPTEAMLKAGEIPTRQIQLGNGTFATGLGFGACAWSMWPRMIDAALSLPSPEGK